MFAAFQKASWNWIPISVSSGTSVTNVDFQPEDRRKRQEMFNEVDGKPSSATTGEWIEIPLSSDDEDRISPRGILQFRKFSEGELSERSKGSDDVDPRTSPWQPASCNTNHFHPKDEQGSMQTRTFAPSHCCRSTKSGKDCGDAQTRPALPCVNSVVDAAPNKVSVRKLQMSEDSNMELVPHISIRSQSSVEASGESKTLLQQKMSNNAETQTPTPRDDFASMKMALQRQLADALNALDLTRSQANALRDRLRTYTTSMKQQTTDLRASSKSLSHALDKAKEYRTNWKREEKLKDEACKKVDDLQAKTESLEKTVSQQNADLKSFSREVDIINELLRVEDAPSSIQNKLTVASTEVKVLLSLVEKVQAEAALASAVNTVELKESLRRFEEEKVSWVAFTTKNEEAFAGKIKFLEMKNEKLKSQISNLQETTVEIKELWQQDRIENAKKEQALKMNDVTIRDLENALSQTREELKVSICSLQSETMQREELRETFHRENNKLAEEKRQIAASLVELKRNFEQKSLNRRDQSVNCDMDMELRISRRDSDSSSQGGLRSFTCKSESQSRHDVSERQSLQTEVKNLKRAMMDMKTEIFEKEQEYFRLRGDVRQLRWTSHHQQVTIQRVRAENRSLRISISKLRREREPQDGDMLTDPDAKNEDLVKSNGLSSVPNGFRRRRRRSSGESTGSDRKPLQTIPESSDQGPLSSPGISPTSSKQLYAHSTPKVAVSAQVNSVSTELSCQKPTPPMESRMNESREKSFMAPQTPSDQGTRISDVSDPQSVPEKKRSQKIKRSKKLSLPIWRQENPNNQFSSTPKRDKTQLRKSSSSGSEDVFLSSTVSRNGVAPISDQTALAELAMVPNQPNRLVGIPMDEKEFERLVGSFDYDEPTPIALDVSGGHVPFGVGDVSLNDDGYSSSVAEAGERSKVHGKKRRHSARLSSDSTNDSSQLAQSLELISSEPEHCYLTFGDATFDAMNFDLTNLRNVAWEAGFAESESAMNGFIDFLAAKALELEEDPRWRGRHSLGKSSDWLSLKGLLC